MARIDFYKFHGTGNDFICIDCRAMDIKLSIPRIKQLCHRRYGIGADGLIFLRKAEGYDFKMSYHNADGRESTMCGNGGRCIVLFAAMQGIKRDKYRFLAIDGEHEAHFNEQEVVLRMADVDTISEQANGWFVDTGSPHLVKFNDNLEDLDFVEQAQSIRYSQEYREKGVNVNYVTFDPREPKLIMRTYERGVENETLSCGTGVVAAALASYQAGKIEATEIKIKTHGGELGVQFVPESSGKGFRDIFLTGPASFVFYGSVECEEPVVF